MKKLYAVEFWDHGMVLYGPMPLDELVPLTKKAKKLGYAEADVGVATAMGALFVFTTAEGSKAWRAEIDRQNAYLPLETQWIRGYDTGTSSRTIFGVMTGMRPEDLWTAKGESLPASKPQDPDDFGRCYRLLEHFPAWEARLPEVAAKYPEWTPLVEHWTELKALYDAGDGAALYDRMQEIEKAGPASAKE